MCSNRQLVALQISQSVPFMGSLYGNERKKRLKGQRKDYKERGKDKKIRQRYVCRLLRGRAARTHCTQHCRTCRWDSDQRFPDDLFKRLRLVQRGNLVSRAAHPWGLQFKLTTNIRWIMGHARGGGCQRTMARTDGRGARPDGMTFIAVPATTRNMWAGLISLWRHVHGRPSLPTRARQLPCSLQHV
jgi:hypothetical protein